MHRAQARRNDRRGERDAAAAEKGRRRWFSARARLHNLCQPPTWPPVAQAVGSAALCGALGALIALAGAG
jgi:hypothetical protein